MGIRPILSLYREILKRKRGPTTQKGDGVAMWPRTLCKVGGGVLPGCKLGLCHYSNIALL